MSEPTGYLHSGLAFCSSHWCRDLFRSSGGVRSAHLSTHGCRRQSMFSFQCGPWAELATASTEYLCALVVDHPSRVADLHQAFGNEAGAWSGCIPTKVSSSITFWICCRSRWDRAWPALSSWSASACHLSHRSEGKGWWWASFRTLVALATRSCLVGVSRRVTVAIPFFSVNRNGPSGPSSGVSLARRSGSGPTV